MPSKLPRKQQRARSPTDPLGIFSPWAARWFRANLGKPTPPQARAWPLIASGQHVLVHAPTGSGKTLAAFLWSLDRLFARAAGAPTRKRPLPSAGAQGVQVLYISPLRALNNDIERNLRVPLAGIIDAASANGVTLPGISVAVRTGDTPPAARAAMLRRPPDILITTPESLFLLLTSPRAREILKTVQTVIVDEIHTVCGNKRGSHLALSLERLERLSPRFQRIGLSATQRPLDEVARFLGGADVVDDGAGGLALTPRPVSIVDTPFAKKLDLQVLGMPEQVEAEFSGSVWPAVMPRLLQEVRRHKTTLVFANSRQQAERAADRLNTQWAAEKADGAQASNGGPGPGPWSLHASMTGSGHSEGPFRAHHGSISQSVRRQLEADLKAGRLPALIGTSSLELGIDIGSVDLVVQLQAPKSVTQGLQRVGRSGHGVGQTSKGRIYALTSEDLAEAAAVTRGMLEGDVEPVRAPRNALDILAQQVVAIVAADEPPASHATSAGQEPRPAPDAPSHPGWPAMDVYRLVRGAYSYSGLTYESFRSVLKLIAGKYSPQLSSALKARVNWDEHSGLLRPLPSARLAAFNQGGALVDRGVFAVYLPDRKTRLGELDEEFVWESRPGDAFMLGSQVWRATSIEDDRVIVEPAPGAVPRMPFWRGDFPWRQLSLSRRVAGLKRELAARLAPHVEEDDDPVDVMEWLQRTYLLDRPGASQLLNHVRRQLRSMGAIASDDTVIIETYQDPVGDRRIVVHSPFGGRVNAPWAIAIASAIKERTGLAPEVQVGDDGMLFRLPEGDDPVPAGLIASLTAAEVRERALKDLASSALFGAVFRQNAARALLLPGLGRGKRTPFWLQRLKAKDLLAIARGFPDFPVLLETYRDCLEDALDIPALEEVIGRIGSGQIKVIQVAPRRPSPMADSLNFGFTTFYMYEWDAPKAERSMQALQLDRAALSSLFRDPSFAGLLKREAIADVTGPASRSMPGYRARNVDELAQLIEDLGDLTEDEIADRCDGDAARWLAELEAGSRVGRVKFVSGAGTEQRWVVAAAVSAYLSAFSADRAAAQAPLSEILARWLTWSGPVGAAAILERYPADEGLLRAALEDLAAAGRSTWGYFTPGATAPEWIDVRALAAIQTRTLSVLRSEVSPVTPLRWQAAVLDLHGIGLHQRPRGKDGLREALLQLAGLLREPEDWLERILPARVAAFSVSDLELLVHEGEFNCIAIPAAAGHAVAFIPRATGNIYLPDEYSGAATAEPALTTGAASLHRFLAAEGVASSADLRAAFPGLTVSQLAASLRELVVTSAATSDSWAAVASALTTQAQPDHVLTSLAPMRPMAGRRRNTSARRTVAARMKHLALALPPDARWWLTGRFSVMGPAVPAAQRAESRAAALLGRHGVVSRRSVEVEDRSWEWREIESALALMELRGKARRGYFVRGLPGIQYARPDLVDKLRDLPRPGNGMTAFCATDPAAVALSAAAQDADAGPRRASRLSSTYLVQAGDRVVLTALRHGEEIAAAPAPDLADAMPAAVGALRARICGGAPAAKRFSVRTWNGQPVLKSVGVQVLTAAGFHRDYPAMSWDPVRGRSSPGVEGAVKPLP